MSKDAHPTVSLNLVIEIISAQRFLIPAVIGTRLITIEVDVVNTDIPLLFSRNSLKKAGMSIDFEKDTVSFLEQECYL